MLAGGEVDPRNAVLCDHGFDLAVLVTFAASGPGPRVRQPREAQPAARRPGYLPELAAARVISSSSSPGPRAMRSSAFPAMTGRETPLSVQRPGNPRLSGADLFGFIGWRPGAPHMPASNSREKRAQPCQRVGPRESFPINSSLQKE